jgi:hypothetical protein
MVRGFGGILIPTWGLERVAWLLLLGLPDFECELFVVLQMKGLNAEKSEILRVSSSFILVFALNSTPGEQTTKARTKLGRTLTPDKAANGTMTNHAGEASAWKISYAYSGRTRRMDLAFITLLPL